MCGMGDFNISEYLSNALKLHQICSICKKFDTNDKRPKASIPYIALDPSSS